MVSFWRKRAHPSFGAVAAGLVVVTLFGSGLFAVVSDSVSVTGAEVESADYVFVEEELDIQIGPITGAEDAADVCTDADGVTYTTADAVAAQAASDVLDIGRWYTDSAYANSTTPQALVGQYCVKNASDVAGALEVQLLSWGSSEVGDCGPTEAAVDASCTSGGTGELGNFGTVEVAAVTGANTYCLGATGTFRRVDWAPATEVAVAKPYAGVVLQPGEACQIDIYVTGTRATFVPAAEWQQVVSDTGEFDIAFNLVAPA